MTELLRFLLSGKWQANTIIIATFLLAATITAIYLIAFFQGREVSFWPPRIGQQETSPSPIGSLREECSRDIVTIRDPTRGKTVPRAFEVSGTLKGIPKNHVLWLISTDRSGSSERYWPQEPVIIDDDSGEWSGRVGGVGKAGETRTFGIFLVGKNGEVLLRYWKLAAKFYVGEGESTKYLPLTELTNDITPCHEIIVKVALNEG